MARLDVHPLAGSSGPSYVLDVQADLLRTLATRAVVPLVPEAHDFPLLRDLNPVFELDGERFVMLTQAIATVPTSFLRPPVTSFLRHHDAVVRALDTLLLGF